MQQPVPHPVADLGILPKPRVPGSGLIANGLNIQDGIPQPGLEAFRGWVLNCGFPGFTLQSLCSSQNWLLPFLCTGLRGLGWYFPKDQLSNEAKVMPTVSLWRMFPRAGVGKGQPCCVPSTMCTLHV